MNRSHMPTRHTTRTMQRKKRPISDDFGLRSPVIHKQFSHTKSDSRVNRKTKAKTAVSRLPSF